MLLDFTTFCNNNLPPVAAQLFFTHILFGVQLGRGFKRYARHAPRIWDDQTNKKCVFQDCTNSTIVFSRMFQFFFSETKLQVAGSVQNSAWPLETNYYFCSCFQYSIALYSSSIEEKWGREEGSNSFFLSKSCNIEEPNVVSNFFINTFSMFQNLMKYRKMP